MAKHKHPQPDKAQLAERVARARSEGRTMQALDLARQLSKADPSPAHQKLVFEVSLERARQLRQAGNTRDGATVAENAAALAQGAEQLGLAVAELAACGAADAAARYSAKLAPEQREGLQAGLVDALLLSGGKAESMPALAAEINALRQAFSHHAGGREEEARAALQPIGSRSPLAEWRLLLRGLQAYHANDDERALENWRRLSAGRAPARLAAPFRAGIDPDYRQSLPADVRQRLDAVLNRTQGPSLRSGVEQVLRNMGPETLDEGLRQAALVMPALRQSAPAVAARLGRALYWCVLKAGPGALPAFRKAVGHIEEDPQSHRLIAMGCEGGDAWDRANEAWRAYEQDILSGKVRAAPAEVPIARALLWLRMGQNASRVPTQAEVERLPEFMRPLAGIKQCKPGAEECFRQAIRLVPSLAEAHDELVEYLMRLGRADDAAQAAREQIAHVPDSLEARQLLGGYHRGRGEFAEAVTHLREALRLKPLDQAARGELAHALFLKAAAQVRAGADPSEDYRQAREFAPAWQHALVDVSWSAALTKLGREDEARERLAQAAGPSALLSYLQVVESARHDLPAPARRGVVRAFNAAIDAELSPAEVVALTRNANLLLVLGTEYHGQQSHTKKIIDAALKAGLEGLSGDDMGLLLFSLLALGPPVRKMEAFLRDAGRRFPTSYMVPYSRARFMLRGEEPDPRLAWNVLPLLEEAEKLLAKAPTTTLSEIVKEDIERLEGMMRAINPMAGRRGGFFSLFGNPFGDDDFDNEDGDF